MKPEPESISLYYKEGTSDKVYQASLEANGSKWVVNFAYGRRGAAMSIGTKTQSPVDYDKAKKIYDQLVRSKTAKGYTPQAGGAAFSGTVTEARDTGIRLQLLNEIDEAEVQKYINDPAYCAQEKYDGRRRALIKDGTSIIGTNRKGLSVEVEDTVKKSALKRCHDFKLDGEAVGDKLYAFDLLELDGVDMRGKKYDDRYLAMLALLSPAKNSNIIPVDIAYTAKEKQKLYDQLVKDRAEGIVFKKLDAPYAAGRPNSGGSMLKFKFYATLSAICSAVNAKRSISLELIHTDDARVNVGNVTVPPNQALPAVGSVVEVRYLYAFKKDDGGGTLYQPILLGVRDDVDGGMCQTSQLKYKKEDDEL